jgi:hypothetical protein
MCPVGFPQSACVRGRDRSLAVGARVAAPDGRRRRGGASRDGPLLSQAEPSGPVPGGGLVERGQIGGELLECVPPHHPAKEADHEEASGRT